jgi:hypothetical protein
MMLEERQVCVFMIGEAGGLNTMEDGQLCHFTSYWTARLEQIANLNECPQKSCLASFSFDNGQTVGCKLEGERYECRT